MKYGICYCYWSKNWEGTDYPQKIERARKCGLDVFEIFYGRLLTMGKKEVDDIRAACRANGVELYCTGGFGRAEDLSAVDAAAREDAVRYAQRVLEALSRVGATNFSGINYSAWCDFDHPERKAERTAYAAESLRKVGKMAGDHGISWNMEVVNRFESFMLNTAAEARALADMVDSAHVNILLDSFHGMIEEDDMAEAIRMAGSRLGHYHVGSNNRKLPGPGDFLPWREIGAALRDVRYDKCVSLEPLVHAGGTVALEGGSVWRPMLPEGLDDNAMDTLLMDALRFIRGVVEG